MTLFHSQTRRHMIKQLLILRNWDTFHIIIRQYTSLIETTLFQCRSYKHWRHINIDHTMLQPCMSTEVYSGEFVLRSCLLRAFHFYPYLFNNSSKFYLDMQINILSSDIVHKFVWLKTRKHRHIYLSIPILKRRTMWENVGEQMHRSACTYLQADQGLYMSTNALYK